jgi:hypothetical protein
MLATSGTCATSRKPSASLSIQFSRRFFDGPEAGEIAPATTLVDLATGTPIWVFGRGGRILRTPKRDYFRSSA